MCSPPAGRLMRCQPPLSVCAPLDRGKCQNSRVHFSQHNDKGSILAARGERRGFAWNNLSPPCLPFNFSLCRSGSCEVKTSKANPVQVGSGFSTCRITQQPNDTHHSSQLCKRGVLSWRNNHERKKIHSRGAVEVHVIVKLHEVM